MVYVKTGTKPDAGTDSIISVALLDAENNVFMIDNLETWGGLMGPGHDYFEAGNLDIFSGRGSCLATPVCLMSLMSGGTDNMRGWYADYVEVFTTKVQSQCAHEHFMVDEWLALDEPPHAFIVIRDKCVFSKKNQTMNSSDVSLSSIV
ncbi:UNVERIFIED_CONTAM: PLAT domain-containing protein 2 [Sesamum latifolium]|uniref:PLAT domain-containing protein 2 n=1 Tax=Sesamum latifolium TaxID=2727402 RepID=A0AAW2WPS6_9LAMI